LLILNDFTTICGILHRLSYDVGRMGGIFRFSQIP
jgi:hypothetical protein